MRTVPREDGPGGQGTLAHGGVRELRVVRWGLVPFWAKDTSIGSRLINARAETVATKPAFRRAFARHRCLLPADGFYEWEKSGDPKHPRKQPYYIRREDGGVLAFAGLYELWRDKDQPEDDRDSWLWTATIITTRAEDEVGRIHDRMPMVIDPARWARLAGSHGDQRRRAARADDARRLSPSDVVSGVNGSQLGPAQRPGADRAHGG